MSLSKQLILLISFMFLAIFSVNLYTSIENVRSYLQVESEVHAQDTATSLGLSLSPYILDENDTILETMVNAIFDRGYYLEILLENRKGKEILKKTNPKSFEEVPQWFIDLLPIETSKAYSDIDAGWVNGGRIYVTIHPGFGYLKLWNQAKESLFYSSITLMIFVIFLILIIQLVLRPLNRIDKLAVSISDGNFGKIEELPWTTDIRNVAISMNMMSSKLEKVIANLNSRLEETSKRLRVDELTGLETKGTFETEMKHRFMGTDKSHIFILRIDQLGDFADSHSSQDVDQFIKGFVIAIKEALNDLKLSGEFLYRIVGSEFVLIAESHDKAAAETLCKQIVTRLTELGTKYDKSNVVHIGGVAFDPHGTTMSLVAAATEAFEKALLIGSNSFYISEDSGNAHSVDEWKSIVSEVIEKQQFNIDFTAKAHSLDADEKLIFEEVSAKVFDADKEQLPIGTFVSVAQNIGKIIEFDIKIIQQVIAYMTSNNIEHDIGINLSFTSMSSNEFRSVLYELLQTNKEIAKNITFCITAYGATKDLISFASFIDFAHRNNTKVILKRFETRFIPMDKLKEFKLDYIRLARLYTENIGQDKEKRDLVEAMKELGDLLDIPIIAEAVESDTDYETVREIGLTAASR